MTASTPTLLASLAALTISIAPAVRAQRADTTATKASLLATDAELARAADPGAFLALVEPDAAVLFPGQPILRGDEARRSFLARYGSPSTYAWHPVHAVVSTDGRFGCTIGFSRSRIAGDTVRGERHGAYTTCWRRTDRGAWRIVGHQRNDGALATASNTDWPVFGDAPHSATTASGDPRTAAQDADAAFAALGAAAAGPGPAFARYAADDAVLLGGAERPRGPAQIAAAFAAYPAARVIAWTPNRAFGAGSGGLAFTVGHSTNGPRAGHTDAGPTSYGKYITVWRQEPDGSWRYVFDLGSPRPND